MNLQESIKSSQNQLELKMLWRNHDKSHLETSIGKFIHPHITVTSLHILDAITNLPLLVFMVATNLVNLSSLTLEPPASFLKALYESWSSFLLMPVISATPASSFLDGPHPILNVQVSSLEKWEVIRVCLSLLNLLNPREQGQGEGKFTWM